MRLNGEEQAGENIRYAPAAYHTGDDTIRGAVARQHDVDPKAPSEFGGSQRIGSRERGGGPHTAAAF